jgi:hypothetical protein
MAEEFHPTDGVYTDPILEARFLYALLTEEEVIVSYSPAETAVESADETRAFVSGIINKYDLRKIGSKYTVANGRYTTEHGHHYWVRMWDPRSDE